MAHTLILGMSESGKSTLAKNLAKVYKSQGWSVIVLDPLKDPEWCADFITADQDEFLSVFWASRKCMVFIDEGGKSVGQYEKAMQECFTTGRHWGHSCHLIAHKGTQLAPVVRDQCRYLFLFCSSIKEGKLLADEFNKPELQECNKLLQGEYIHASKFGATTYSKRGVKNEPTASSSRSGSADLGPTVGRQEDPADAGSEAGETGSEIGGSGED